MTHKLLLPTQVADPQTDASGTSLYAKAGGVFTKSPAGAVSQLGGGSPIVGSTVLGSPASTISVSGLNGDADREYEIEFNYIATTTAAHDVDIRPNGDTAANRQTTRVYNGSSGSYTNGSGLFAANGAVTTAVSIRATFKCFVYRDPGITYYRRFVGESVLAFDNGVGTGIWVSSTTYASNVSNLTSFTIGVTNVQFATGSELIVRRLVR